MDLESISKDATLKPWQKTSYFLLMVAVVFGGGALSVAAGFYLPHISYLNDQQRARILEIMFQSWGGMSAIVIGGNVAARGGVTLLKQLMKNQVAEAVVSAQSPPVEVPSMKGEEITE